MDRHGVAPNPVDVRPQRELVQVVADARELTGAFALDGPCGRGPGPGLRHRAAQQLERRHARRRRLLPPGGVPSAGVTRGASIAVRRTATH